MAKESKRPVFHQATEAPKPDFEPHHVGAKEAHHEPEPHHEEAHHEPDPPPHEGDLPHGWRVITPEQHTGATFLVSHDLEAPGTRAFWRKTRVLSHAKWVAHGKWSDSLTRGDVLPEPRFFKGLAE